MVKQHASSPKHSGSYRSTEVLETTVGVVLRALLYVYRLIVSPLLPRTCRFHPTCSRFALEALAEHGPIGGTRLTVARLVRCHPWNPGGHDPVPSRKA